MSSNSMISTLLTISREILIYGGILLLIIGTIGNSLNIILFLSLKTFRQTSSVVYLTVSSFVHIGLLLTGLLSRIVFNVFDVDWTSTSPFYCKFRMYLLHFCGLSSLISILLAIVDQFFATSTHVRWQQWSNIKVSRYLSTIMVLFWSVYLCPHLIYFNVIETTRSTCTITNPIYSRYYNDFFIPVLWFLLPYFLIILFCLLTYRNIRHISYRTVPLLRRRIDEQLTVMIFVQAVFSVIIALPYMILLTVVSHMTFTADQLTIAQLQLTQNITICLYYIYPACPFYIYICVSERFRRQLQHVFIGFCRNQWNKRRIHTINQLEAQLQEP